MTPMFESCKLERCPPIQGGIYLLRDLFSEIAVYDRHLTATIATKSSRPQSCLSLLSRMGLGTRNKWFWGHKI